MSTLELESSTEGVLERARSRYSASDAVAAPAPAPPAATGPHRLQLRIADAALRRIGRHGVAKTTLDEIATEAGCSRATVYRAFPGGKDAVLNAVVETEVSRLFCELGSVMARAADLEELLVSCVTEAARALANHQPLSYVLENEPEVVLPHLAFSHMDELLALSSKMVFPYLERWMSREDALEVGEWVTRIVVSCMSCPDPDIDLTDARDVRELIAKFVLPGIEAKQVRRTLEVRPPQGKEEAS